MSRGIGTWERSDQRRSGVASEVEVGVEWRALGPVEVLVDGRLVDLGRPTQRALFGLLLSRVDQPVALDAVIEQLWARPATCGVDVAAGIRVEFAASVGAGSGASNAGCGVA
jgi:hypothetical protein